MKVTDLYARLDLMPNKDFIENFLNYSSSLIISGVKPAVTLTLNKQDQRLYESWNDFGKTYLNELSLEYIKLTATDRADIVLIYDKNLLENELNNKLSLEFLYKIGYPKKLDVSAYLKTLKNRYLKNHCPHELGLFLGIPIEDVKDFISCTPKACLLCGYWKVYNNPKQAISTFRKYDMIRAYTIKNILEGNLAHNLALELKRSFHTLNTKYTN